LGLGFQILAWDFGAVQIRILEYISPMDLWHLRQGYVIGFKAGHKNKNAEKGTRQTSVFAVS
jgi:hypothetical protein